MPIAAAIGSSTRYTRRAPARSADSRTARFSTAVIPEGTAITTRGPITLPRPLTFPVPLPNWTIPVAELFGV